MDKHDDNSPYRSVDRLEACMQERDRWCLVMEADCGGWPLVACPLAMLQAVAEVRAQILLDLEDIIWGRGFRSVVDSQYSDAQEMLYRGTVDEISAGRWFAPRGLLHRGVWIEQTIHDAEVRDQIVRVLTGQQPRLLLPEWWPNDAPIPFHSFASLEEARVYATRAIAEIEPRGRGACETMIRIPVDQIKIDESDLVRLSEYLARLDSLTEGAYVPGSVVRKSLITYRVQPNMRKRRLNDVWIADWIAKRGLRDMILSVLRGQQAVP